MGCGTTKDKAKNTQETNNQIHKNVPQQEPEKVKAEAPKVKEANVNVIISLKHKIIFNDVVPTTTTLDEIKQKLSLNKLVCYGFYVNNEEIKEDWSKRISEIFPNIKDKIEITITSKGWDLPENAQIAYAENTKVIGSLILDNPEYFGIITFQSMTSQMSGQRYTLAEHDIWRRFSLFSAFCNANGSIYLSGGEVQQNPQNESEDKDTKFINNFVAINITNLTQGHIDMRVLPDLIEARTWHSMIFVPNKYIFIVGGINVKSVELYDIQWNTVIKDSDLLEARSESSLCLANNSHWYAFCGFQFNQTFLTTIERCNWHQEVRTWEKVDYTLDNNMQFTPSFFGVAYYKNNLILFGENENRENSQKNYKVTLGENVDVISEFNLVTDDISVFREKFFLPINDDVSVCIPLVSNQTESLLFYHELGEIKKKVLDENGEGSDDHSKWGEMDIHTGRE